MVIKHIEEDGKGRFSAMEDNTEVGYLRYEIMDNGSLKANGTFVEEAYRPKKYGIDLFNAFIAHLEMSGRKAYPTCPFVVKMFSKKPELSLLLDESYQPE